ncbi:hypothetical protein HBZS_107220 [Helicobacter bizzozeronii CCUG 35545]|nr:hypothetical protein HBZS_107220 [Helicobacter bizzozeronii CCUG 35545]
MHDNNEKPITFLIFCIFSSLFTKNGRDYSTFALRAHLF